MLPDGPPSPAFWQTYRFIMDPDGYVAAIRGRYGDAVRYRSLIGPGVAVLESGLAREVFAAPPDTFEPAPVIESIFGRSSVIAVSGARHRRLRKLLNPSFHGAQIRGFMASMRRAIRRHVEGLDVARRTREVVVTTDVTQAMTLDVILETVFGAGDLDRDAARQVLLDVIRGFSPAIVGGETLHRRWFPPWRRFLAARAAFDRWVDDVVRARRARGGGDDGQLGDDVLGVLLAARDEDGEPMDDTEIREQLHTLLLAGHETSAIAMAWCVHHLLRAPEALARLRGEIDALGADPSPADVTRAPFLGAVVRETLRLEPVVTDIVRVCRVPFTLGDRWTIPAGESVAVLLGAILRDPRVFRDPSRFRPERFLERDYSIAEFVPFGGGARRCLGAAFAEAELAIAIAEIATRWDLALVDATPERSVRRNVTMGPSRGVRVRVLKRRTRASAEASRPRLAGV
jgi:cytochrome P450